MNTMSSVRQFLAQKNIAVVGVSRSGKKFGNSVIKELQNKGYNVYGINSNVEKINEQKLYPNLQSVPDPLDAVLFVVQPLVTEKIIQDVYDLGIKNVWMQYGSQSEKAVNFCKENGINIVSDECILMFAEPVGLGHRLHRWIWKIAGKLPK